MGDASGLAACLCFSLACACGLVLARLRDLFAAILAVFAALAFFAAGLAALKAAEAAFALLVGAGGFGGILMMAVLPLAGSDFKEVKRPARAFASGLGCALLVCVLIYAALDLPDPGAGPVSALDRDLLRSALAETGSGRASAALGLNYRPLDLVAIACALAASGFGVWALLGFGERALKARTLAPISHGTLSGAIGPMMGALIVFGFGALAGLGGTAGGPVAGGMMMALAPACGALSIGAVAAARAAPPHIARFALAAAILGLAAYALAPPFLGFNALDPSFTRLEGPSAQSLGRAILSALLGLAGFSFAWSVYAVSALRAGEAENLPPSVGEQG